MLEDLCLGYVSAALEGLGEQTVPRWHHRLLLEWCVKQPLPSGAHKADDAAQLDTHVSALLHFPCGGVGTIECSLGHASPREATVCGTKGVLRVPYPFWCPTEFSVQTMSGPASQQWSEPQTYRTALPEVAGDFNFDDTQEWDDWRQAPVTLEEATRLLAEADGCRQGQRPRRRRRRWRLWARDGGVL